MAKERSAVSSLLLDELSSSQSAEFVPTLLRSTDPKQLAAFSYHTRYYLRRRAWRYFRRIGFQRPDAYCAAIAEALVRYEDAELASGIDVLDSWTLVHACFGKHDVLDLRSASHVRLK